MRTEVLSRDLVIYILEIGRFVMFLDYLPSFLLPRAKAKCRFRGSGNYLLTYLRQGLVMPVLYCTQPYEPCPQPCICTINHLHVGMDMFLAAMLKMKSACGFFRLFCFKMLLMDT